MTRKTWKHYSARHRRIRRQNIAAGFIFGISVSILLCTFAISAGAFVPYAIGSVLAAICVPCALYFACD